jgi:RNA polymerase sigma-70 factor (sigma-E family)
MAVNFWPDWLRVRSENPHRADQKEAAMRRDTVDLDSRFTAFVREHGDRHLRVAVLLTGDWHAAEDLVQASLVKLYRAWPRLDTSVDPDAYLRRVIVNTHRSWWRARWRRELPVAVLPDRADAGDLADQQALGAVVRQALAALPRQQRAVLVLRYGEDLPEAAVAELLGCSAGSIKTHAYRGLRALRQQLGGEWPQAEVNQALDKQRDRR